MTAANRVAEIFDAPREITDGPESQPPRGGRLELVDVGFRFPDPRGRCRRPASSEDDWALRHVNVTVEPGETLALVGSTGSGKSVLVSLLSRLYDVTEGAIRIDGHDIRELSLPALRQAVATAFEDPTLFSMSVAENLRLGRGRTTATDEQMAQAIEVAAAQFVYDLPFGLDTRIGEQGMSLSGGQRQRLSLARAHRSRRRRSWCSTTPSRRSTCTPRPSVDRGVAPRAARGDRRRRRPPGVDGAARRPGGAARGRHDHARRHPRRTARRRTAVPLSAGRRRRTRRRRRARLRLGRTTRTAAGSTSL